MMTISLHNFFLGGGITEIEGEIDQFITDFGQQVLEG